MAVYIRDFQIDSFRGIHNLTVQGLNHINLIVGDNNSGKTSFMEALLLLRNPGDITNVLRVARQRDAAFFTNRVSPFENFIYLFPQDAKRDEIGITSLCRNEQVEFLLQGEQKQVLLDEGDFNNIQLSLFDLRRREREMPTSMEAHAFVGTIEYRIGNRHDRKVVKLNEFSRISGMEIKSDNLLNMIYLSPIDHMKSNIINHIVRNDGYKEICLRVIQLFDPDILDLLILKNELTNRPVEYIKHRVLGNMPISTYGDGIRKVLLLSNAIAQSAGGVLLIDEVETAIHVKYYDDIFRFLVKACIQYDVQVFITTHNLEAVDALLATQDYTLHTNADDISVITLKKGPDQIYTRIMPGRKVQENRESFNFEVRL